MPLPTGPAVTFLFTDIEGSTRLERSVGAASWAATVARHDALLRGAIEAGGGVVVKTEGDAFFAAFDLPAGAVAGAVAAQRAVAAEPWAGGIEIRVRMGVHVGEGRLRAGGSPGDPEDYVGIDVNYTARIAAAGNGGQIVLSDAVVRALPRNVADIAGIGEVVLVDVGPRTVKDFDEPTPLHRLVVPGAADDERALRTTDIPSNLPGEVTTLVGRDEEIARLVEILTANRIVTLTGPGGSGKTRLALGVARDVRDRFPHGTWFVDLAALTDPALIETSIAAVLGVRESPERAISEALGAHLRDRTMLLVLDNLEQLLPAAADVVARLVRSAPSLRVLITSRELLRIAGEQGHPVPPLDMDAGIALFIDRARALRPNLEFGNDGLAATRAISERLGGLPLAIELAAARTRIMTPAQILERLGRSLDLGGGSRDLPERQRTLRGAIAWSHDMLPQPERRLFARLGVFAGGCTFESAAAVADPVADLGIDLVEGLESLVDKSLVRVEQAPDAETRSSLHPLLREFALERLEDAGERPTTEERFATECVDIAEASGGAIRGQAGEASLRRLDREEHNLHAAIDWGMAHDRPDIGLRIMGSIWRWFQQRGRLREARAILADLLARPAGDPRVRIAGLAAEGGLAYWMNDFGAARTAYEERSELATATGDRELIADGHYDLGFMAMVAGEGELLRMHEEQALEFYLAAGLEDGAVLARQALVLGIFLGGDYARARALEEENLAFFRRAGSENQVADSVTFLSAVTWKLRDLATSWARVHEGLSEFARLDSWPGLARVLGMAAIYLLHDGDAELGARVAGATYRLARDKGLMIAPVAVLHLPDPAGTAAERFGAERADALMAEGAATPIETIIERVLAEPPAGG